MATTSVYLQLRGVDIPRIITATSLAWVHGTRLSVVVGYRSAASSGSSPNITTTMTIKTLTAVAEVAPSSTGSQSTDVTYTPYTAAAVLYPTLTLTDVLSTDPSTLLTAGPELQILNLDVMHYIRFTGTELGTSGAIVNADDIIAMFYTTPAPTDL